MTVIPISGINSEIELEALINRLNNISEIEYVNHFLIYHDGVHEGIFDELFVKLHSVEDYSILQTEVENLNAEILEVYQFNNLIYKIGVNSSTQGNALEVANKIHETGLFDFSEPNFLKLMAPSFELNKSYNEEKKVVESTIKNNLLTTNDTHVGDQWSLNNDGVNTSNWGGVAGADINVFSAWNTTTGSPSIKVAIIDTGVDLVHPDLAANLLTGYDASGATSGEGSALPQNNAHGTACAGIVASIANNNIGTAGVAYDCKIIPIKVFNGLSTTISWLAGGIDWAWQTGGADVLSNSWGGGSPSSTIQSAIDGAVQNGRGGLGSPVLFSCGNGNGSVIHPANYEPTIAVVAMSMCDERKSPSSCDGETWWGSDYGTGADIAAPGVKIYTTDVSGASGYEFGDYTPDFNGTSSACPNAAGVMALILSANQSYTETEARAAIESTCVKAGGYSYTTNPLQPNGTWSSEFGYGRVDAAAAVGLVSIANDAKVESITESNGITCFGATPYDFQVILSNVGSNTLNSVVINYNLNGGINSSFNWTGSLATNASEIVTLPTINLVSGINDITVFTSEPNNVADENPVNDLTNLILDAGYSELNLTIVFDDFPEENSCEILDDMGVVLWEVPSFSEQSPGSTITEDICISHSCDDMSFTFYDLKTNGICCNFGNGSYSLREFNTGNILAFGGDFGSSETTPFNLSGCGPPCPPNLVGTNGLTGTVTDNTNYATSGDIQFNQIILSPSIVNYDAGGSIELQDGFEVKQGVLFQALMDGCPPSVLGEEEKE